MHKHKTKNNLQFYLHSTEWGVSLSWTIFLELKGDGSFSGVSITIDCVMVEDSSLSVSCKSSKSAGFCQGLIFNVHL